jgi:hypothetical protein
LGENFRTRYFKYNSGKLADLTPENTNGLFNNVRTILEGLDPKVEELGYGVSSALLATIVRNYEKHTARSGFLEDEYYFQLFDRILLGLVWFYGYSVEKDLLDHEKIVLYYGGRQPKLLCDNQNYTIETINEFEAPTGSFIPVRLVQEDSERRYMLTYVDKNLSPALDLNRIQDSVSKSRLPAYHSICLKNENILIEDQDRELFIIKLNWFEKNKTNTTYHRKKPAYFDKREETGRFALNHEMSGFYALAYQSGITTGYFSLITPIRFFSCIDELSSFLKVFSFDFDDLNSSDIAYLNGKLLHNNQGFSENRD